MKFFEALISRRTKTIATPLLAAMLAIGSVNAWADEASEVSRLIKAGQLDQAMARADVFLSTKPRDAQMRFLKGLILTEKNKQTEAITVFTKLTEDFPELPEPYNNLAVLYASQGQYDKARNALEMAIRTHPSYATAHENLGDVYAKLASQSYDKALQLDSGNATAQTKLALIRDLIGNKSRGTAVATAPVAAAAAAPAVVAAVTPTPAAKPVAEAPKPKEVVKEAPKDAAKPSDDDVIKTVNDWAKAWSDQEVDAYLAFYAKDFETPGGQNRKRWESERRKRIEGKGRIEVKVENIAVAYEDGKAVAKFKQTYTSDKLSNVTGKTIVFIKSGGRWQILEERASS